MHVGAVIRKKREERNLTQKSLARRIGLSESSLRMYELGFKDTPHDVVRSAATSLQAPEICFAKCQECPVNWLSVCIVKGDTHPAEQILRVLEEAREAIQAVERMASRLTARAQIEVVQHACDQVLDLVPLAATAITAWTRAFGIDAREVSTRHRNKLVARDYLGSKEGAA